MEKFIVYLESVSNNGTPWTTRLTIEADNKNQAAIKAINWLTEKELTLDKINIHYKEYFD